MIDDRMRHIGRDDHDRPGPDTTTDRHTRCASVHDDLRRTMRMPNAGPDRPTDEQPPRPRCEQASRRRHFGHHVGAAAQR